MNVEGARRVKALFEQALDAPPGERSALLDRACGEDGALRAEVEALLATDAAKGAFLETPAAGAFHSSAAADAQLEPGREVGGFRIVGVLGEGGGGVVHEAEQIRPHRIVALKLVRTPAVSRDGLARFLDEAETLARLQHEGIAHVYAAGLHAGDGRELPWIAMERVEGAQSLVRHADERRLGLAARLRLFLLVCDALQYAHEKGVVHGDVKPGNVLVDARGRPKLVDFGLARGVGERDAARRGVAGTIAYMAPEQLAADAAAADVRSDVYALGVVLHELLSGALPHDVDGVPLSEAVRRRRDEASVPFADRAPSVPADLASIVERAIARERGRRYASVAAMSDDVVRWLAHEPVAAHDGGALYHVAKFARRRRGLAAAIVAVAAAAAAATAASLRAAYDSERARRREEFHSYVANIAAAAAALRVDDAAETLRHLERAPAHLRDWEWHHLRARADLSGATVRWEGHAIRDGAVSEDGELVAALGFPTATRGAATCSVAVWRADGTFVRSFAIDSPAQIAWGSSVALSRDHARLAVGYRNGVVSVEDAATGASRWSLEAHDREVVDVAFSPAGDLVVTASADGTLRLIEAANGRAVRELRGHADRVISAAFAPAGDRIYSGGRDGAIREWDVASGRTLRVLEGHGASVEGVAPSPDGARLASASRDGTVRLWDLATGRLVATRFEHRSNVRDVAFARDGRTFASASWDGTVRVWDAATAETVSVLRGHQDLVASVSCARGALALVSFSRDGTWRRWDPRRRDVAELRGLGDRVDAISVHAGGDLGVARCGDGTAFLFSVREPRRLASVADGVPLRAAAFVGDDRLVAIRRADLVSAVWRWTGGIDPTAAPVPVTQAGHRTGELVALHPREMRAWSVDHAWPTAARATELRRIDLAGGAASAIRTVPGPVTCLTWHAGADRLALGTSDGTVVAWDAARPGAAVERRVHDGPVAAVAFDPSATRLVTASGDRTALVLSLPDLGVVHRLAGHSAEVRDALFLPGGRRVVTCALDRTVKLWDAATGELVLTLLDADYAVHCLAVTPDGTTLLGSAGAMEDVQSSILVWTAPTLGAR